MVRFECKPTGNKDLIRDYKIYYGFEFPAKEQKILNRFKKNKTMILSQLVKDSSMESLMKLKEFGYINFDFEFTATGIVVITNMESKKL